MLRGIPAADLRQHDNSQQSGKHKPGDVAFAVRGDDCLLYTSSKHKCKWLTYSSLAQVCKYANRVSYQVLNQHSPRLTRGLPEREDSLEEAYWDR